ncbi:MAG: hypothetical protein PHE53_09790 [Thermoguttaceae bacterium]|nr:hypothetical protein [Thermoguttaceae bacterium]
MRTDTERFRMRCFNMWTFWASMSLSMLWAAVFSCIAIAQDGESTTPSEPAIPSAEAVAVTEPVAETPNPPRNQLIYIPYEKLKKTFEKEGRGVFLPYEQFQELWNAAQASREPVPTDLTAPVDWVITDAENVAIAEADVVRVTSTIRFEILKKGWFGIPLRLGDAAILSATLDGQTARVVPDEAGGFKLLVENPSEKESRRGILTLEFAKKIERSPGRNAVSFQPPQVPVSRWTAKIVEPGVDVTFSPMLATSLVGPDVLESEPGQTDGTEASQLDSTQESRPADESGGAEKSDESKYGTVVRAFVGAAPEVRIEWTARTEGATGLAALAGVQTDQNVTIGESVLRNRVTMVWTISRADIPTLMVKIPADQKIINVFDPNVKQWSVEPWNAPTQENTPKPEAPGPDAAEPAPTESQMSSEPTFQKLVVTLFEPAKKSQTLVIETEKFSETQTLDQSVEVTVPVFEALDVARQQGLVAVQVESGIRAELVRSGSLLRVDTAAEGVPVESGKGVPTPVVSPSPDGLAGVAPPWSGTWRYATAAFDLVLKLEKIQPRIRANLLSEVEIRPDQRLLRTTAEYWVEDAGTFDLTLDIPDEYDVQALYGRGYLDVQSAAVAGWALEAPAENPDGPKTRLAIRLARKTLGKIGIQVQLIPKKKDGVELNSVAITESAAASTSAAPTSDTPAPDAKTPNADVSSSAGPPSSGTESGEKVPVAVESSGENKDNAQDTQSEKTMKWRFAMPTIRDTAVTDVNHTFVVLAPDRLQVSVGDMLDAMVASPADVYLNATPVGNGVGTAVRSPIPPMISISNDPADPKRVVPVAAFLAGRMPITMEITAVPRKPQIVVRQFLKVHVDEGQVQYEATFFYDIRYSGVAQLRLEVPKSITATLQNNTTGIYDTTPETVSPELPKGYVTKAYRSDSELFGTRSIQLAWKEKLPSLEPGQRRRIVIPRLIPVGVTTAWGQIGISKAEAIDVAIAGDSESDANPALPMTQNAALTEGTNLAAVKSTEKSENQTTSESIENGTRKADVAANVAADGGVTKSNGNVGLQPIDPRYDLMPGITAEGVTSAFSFFSDFWTLSLDVTRYALESPADTSVEKALVQMVLTRAQKISVQAVWKFQSARQRLSLWLPPDATLESQPRLDGKPIVLEKGDAAADGRGAWFYLPIPRVDPNHLMLLQLRYTMPAETGTVLREMDTKATLPGNSVILPLPKLGRETPVQKMMIATWIPKEFQPIDHGGAWSLVGTAHQTFGADTYSYYAKMMDELVEDLPADVASQRETEWSDFPIDGTETTFVAVGPTGNEPLELRYMKRIYVELLVFGVTLLVGLLVWFVPRSLRGRLVAIGLAGIVWAILLLLNPDIGVLSIESILAFGAAMLMNVGIWALSCGWMVWRFFRNRKSVLVQSNVLSDSTASDHPFRVDSGTVASESHGTDQAANRAEEDSHD